MKLTVLFNYSGAESLTQKDLRHDYSFFIFDSSPPLISTQLLFIRSILTSFIHSGDLVSSRRLLTPSRAKYKPDCSDGSHTARRLFITGGKKSLHRTNKNETFPPGLCVCVCSQIDNLFLLGRRSWADACNFRAVLRWPCQTPMSNHLTSGPVK